MTTRPHKKHPTPELALEIYYYYYYYFLKKSTDNVSSLHIEVCCWYSLESSDWDNFNGYLWISFCEEARNYI